MNKTQSQLKSKSIYDCHFSTGIKYVAPCDRVFYKGLSKEEYHHGFTEHDQLLDAAIERGYNLDLGGNLWCIYDDAVNNYELTPLDPYEWLFKHATLTSKSIVVSIPENRILLLYGNIHMEYYDFIHGLGKFFARYSRPVY